MKGTGEAAHAHTTTTRPPPAASPPPYVDKAGTAGRAPPPDGLALARGGLGAATEPSGEAGVETGLRARRGICHFNNSRRVGAGETELTMGVPKGSV